MFDHLDDANPLRADADVRRAVAARSTHLRRRQHRVVALVAVVTVALGSAGIALAVRKPDNRRRVVVTNETSSSLGCGVLVPPTTVDVSGIPDGTPRQVTATLGTFTARLQGTSAHDNSQDLTLEGATLTVLDGGRVVRTSAVQPPKSMPRPPEVQTEPVVIPRGFSTGPVEADAADMCVARFAGSDQPVVLIGLWSGGAPCCYVMEAFPASDTPETEHDFGRTYASVRDHPGGAVLYGTANTFFCRFTACAEGGGPVQVFDVDNGAFVDVTGRHLDLVADDAQRWKMLFDSHPPEDGLGTLAAWVADECVLGYGADAYGTVDQLNSQGKLSGQTGWPQGSGYVSALHDELHKDGYC